MKKMKKILRSVISTGNGSWNECNCFCSKSN